MELKERLEKHQELREKVMNEKDIELTNKYIDWFKSSWMEG